MNKTYKEDPMTTWIKNNNSNNENPGTFKRLVEEDEKAYKKRQKVEQELENELPYGVDCYNFDDEIKKDYKVVEADHEDF